MYGIWFVENHSGMFISVPMKKGRFRKERKGMVAKVPPVMQATRAPMMRAITPGA